MLWLKPTPAPDCPTHHNAVQLGVSIFLAVGLLCSYLPQHYRIIVNRTSEGFSPYFLLLGVISSSSSFLNILVLSWNVIMCCGAHDPGTCLESLMGVIQIGIQFTMFSLIFILFIIYFPEQKKLEPYIPAIHHGTPPTNLSWEWRLSLIVAAICSTQFVLAVTISAFLLLFVGPNDPRTLWWAGFLGLTSTLLASFQYIPQIIYTWRSKRVGALSIPMMLLQTPGAFVFAASLAAREETNWTTWIVFFVTGCLQGILLMLCLYYHFQAKRLGLDDLSGVKVVVVSEGRPGSGKGGVRRGTKRGGGRKTPVNDTASGDEGENGDLSTERTALLGRKRDDHTGEGSNGGLQ